MVDRLRCSRVPGAWPRGLLAPLASLALAACARAPEGPASPVAIIPSSWPATREPSLPEAVGPGEPTTLAPFAIGLCDLALTPTHVYWLEIRFRSATSRPKKGLQGAVLTCADAGGALLRASRQAPSLETLALLDYRPFGLEHRGERFFWTGAPCAGGGRSSRDPDWLWTWDSREGLAPRAIGDRDRSYLGVVAAEGATYVSDRFGRGGAHRFAGESAQPEQILPEDQEPWLVAADATRLWWADRSRTLWETDLASRRSVRRAALGAMPSDAHLFAGGLLVRTTEEILVLSADYSTIRIRIPIPSYGDRGSGSLARDRYYYWADGRAALSRLDLKTGAVRAVSPPTAQQACGVAVDGGALYWADRGRGEVVAWNSAVFDAPPP